MDLRLGALPVDLRDRVGLAEEHPAVVDPELVAVERSHRRAGRAVALVVVLAAVARAAEAGGGGGRDPGDHVVAGSLVLLVVVERKAVHLHRAAEVDAPVGERCEARDVVEEPVVPDVRRSAGDLTVRRVEQEGDDHEVVQREVVERRRRRPREWPCLMKGGRSVKPRTGAVTMPPIRAPRPSVDASRNTERGYLMTSPSPGSAIGGPALRCGRRRRLGLGLRRSGAPEAPRDLADPEEAEDRRQHGADGDDDRLQDQADEDADDADGESDRPDGRRGLVRGAMTAVRIHVSARIQSGLGANVNDVAIAATSGRQFSVRAAARRSLFRLRRKTSTT